MSCYSCKLTQSRVNKGFLLLTVAEATNSIAYTEYQRHNIVDEENIGRVNLAVDFRGFVARDGLWGCWVFFWFFFGRSCSLYCLLLCATKDF